MRFPISTSVLLNNGLCVFERPTDVKCAISIPAKIISNPWKKNLDFKHAYSKFPNRCHISFIFHVIFFCFASFPNDKNLQIWMDLLLSQIWNYICWFFFCFFSIFWACNGILLWHQKSGASKYAFFLKKKIRNTIISKWKNPILCDHTFNAIFKLNFPIFRFISCTRKAKGKRFEIH